MRLFVVLAALAVGTLRFVLRARVPDDYDAFGFVRAVTDFDLARLQPHFPGYPVYVALTRLVHLVVRSPLEAAEAVNAIAAAVTTVALARLAHGLASELSGGLVGRRATFFVVALYAGDSLPFVLGGAAISDGTATAFAVLAFATLIAPRHPLASGVFIAVMLGTRASYWPIALSWGMIVWRDRETRAVSAVAAMIGILAWLVPFVVIVGPRALYSLGRTHLVGHFLGWGGSIVTRPNLAERIAAFARDLAYDGVAPNWAALMIVLIVVLVCGRMTNKAARRSLTLGLLVAAPYALWVLFAQNVIEQPRHVLPLVAAVLLAICLLVAERPLLGSMIVVCVACAGIPVAILHATTLPAAAQAAAWVGQTYAPRDVALFGGRSLRFFSAPTLIAHERTWMSEVYVDLERVDRLPLHVLVTSEVEGAPTHGAVLIPGPTFCRDPRLDRQQTCITLREYQLPGVGGH